MLRDYLRFSFVFGWMALVNIGCGSEPATQPKPGEQPNAKQAEKEKMKGGPGEKK